MTEDKPIYISAEDDITTIRERLSTTASRYVTLIIPEQSQLRSLTAWRILHKTARELGKEVSVISTDPLVRSVAKEANFKVAQSPTSTLSSKAGGKSGKSRPPSRPGGTVKLNGTESGSEAGNTKGTGGTPKGKTSSLLRSTKSPTSSPSSPSSSTRQPESGPTNRQQSPQTTQTEQFHQWYRDVPESASFLKRETERPVEQSPSAITDALFNHATASSDTESPYGHIYDLGVSGHSSSFGTHSSPPIDGGVPYSVDDEDYKRAEAIRNSAKESAIPTQTPLSPSTPAEMEPPPIVPLKPTVSPSTPSPSGSSRRYSVRDLHTVRDELDNNDVHDISDIPSFYESSDASYRTTPLPPEGKDPYANMEDDSRPPSFLAEQHASATVDSLDTSEHSIQGASSDIIDGEVEYLGDSDEGIQSSFMPTPITSPETLHSWGEPLQDEEQPDEDGPSRLYKPSSRSRRENRGTQGNQGTQGTQGTQGNSARSGQLGQKIQPREGRTYGAASARAEFDDPDYIPPLPKPVEELPTISLSPQEAQEVRNRRISGKIPPAPVTPSKKLQGTGASQTKTPKMTSKALPIESATSRRALQPVPARSGPTTTTRQAQQGSQVARTATKRPPSAKSTKKLPPSRRSNGLAYVIPIVIVAILIGLLAYLGPTANVIIALPAKDYTHAIILKAGSGAGVQPSEQFSNNFVATGVGKATGTVNVGTAAATGTVTFANTGSTDVKIPTGIVVTTSSGIAFATTAEAVVTKAGDTTSNPIDVPVQAQNPGKSGNTSAGTITVFPNTSLTTIAQANNGMTDSNIKLTVVNSSPTTGGGTGTALAATQQDINTTRATLDKTLNAQYESWLKQHSASTDLTGMLSKVEKVLNAPAVGATVAGDGTFTEKLSMNVSIAVIRAATLQEASATQINQALKGDKTYSGYVVVTDPQHPIQVQKLQTPTTDGKVVTFKFVGAGKIVPNISTQQIQHLIAGKRAADARALLRSQLPNVRNVTITTGPQFGSWSPGIIPLWPGHIDIHLVPSV